MFRNPPVLLTDFVHLQACYKDLWKSGCAFTDNIWFTKPNVEVHQAQKTSVFCANCTDSVKTPRLSDIEHVKTEACP